MRKLFCSLLISLLISFTSFAQLRLPAVISSGMVLQQNDSVTLWGWGYNGQLLKVTGSWNNITSSVPVTNMGKWSLKIKTPAAGGPYTVRVSNAGSEILLTDVLIGEVWICSGQSNMEMSFMGARHTQEDISNSNNKNIRLFQVPHAASDYPQDDMPASWKTCDSNSVKYFTAVGYYFGKKLQQALNVPVGLINSSWGGTPAETWTPAESIYDNDILKKSAAQLQEVPWGPVKPGLLYNGMLAPLTKYTIAGALWYQGEANVGNNNGTYSLLLTNMIDAWRKKWNKEFPFYYVQIAPFNYGKNNEGALLQEQQTKVMGFPKTGMVVITDLIDSVTNIHPTNKKDVGLRLANWALAETYHQAITSYRNPGLMKMEKDKNKLILSFDNVPNGLMVKDKTVTGFYISGEKEEWFPAEIKIDNNKIIAWNDKLKEPVYIRYSFSNTIVGNLFSKEGLPVVPFRTDRF